MTDKSVDTIIKNLVLAHSDGEIKAIAAVVISTSNETEMYLGFDGTDAYAVIASLEIIKANILKQLLDEAGRTLGNRE